MTSEPTVPLSLSVEVLSSSHCKKWLAAVFQATTVVFQSLSSFQGGPPSDSSDLMIVGCHLTALTLRLWHTALGSFLLPFAVGELFRPAFLLG